MLSVIIINYNQEAYLLKCLTSIYKYLSDQKIEVIVINNGQDDLTEIKKQFSETKFINSENNGYSHANNLGVRYSSASILFFLNADTELTENFNLDFLNDPASKDFAVLGVKLLYPDRSFQCSFGYFPNIYNEWRNKRNEAAFKKNRIKYIKKLEKKYSQTQQVDWVTGAAMLVKRDIFEKIGGFDERFFLSYEDIDLCKRVNEHEGKVIYYPYSQIIHHKGELVRNNFKDEIYSFTKKSQLIYYKLHNNIFQRFLLRLYILFKDSITN